MRIELAVMNLAGTNVSDPDIVEASVRQATSGFFDEVVCREYRGASKLDMLPKLVGPENESSHML